jgi:hypothetical protein
VRATQKEMCSFKLARGLITEIFKGLSPEGSICYGIADTHHIIVQVLVVASTAALHFVWNGLLSDAPLLQMAPASLFVDIIHHH